jgi:hypothetical protein
MKTLQEIKEAIDTLPHVPFSSLPAKDGEDHRVEAGREMILPSGASVGVFPISNGEGGVYLRFCRLIEGDLVSELTFPVSDLAAAALGVLLQEVMTARVVDKVTGPEHV